MGDKQKNDKKTPVLVVVGPTASGKTDLGIYLAKHLQGEIISADSMQIYEELSIGTAKPTSEQREEAKHHLIDCVSIDKNFSVADYIDMAAKAIDDVVSRKKLPIIVGGTGQYIDALLYGMSFAPESSRNQVRQNLQNELQANGKEALWRRLFQIDPAYARTLHYQNSKRVLRGIEIYQTTGKTMSEQLEKNSSKKISIYEPLIIGISTKDRSKLYERIERRVDKMCEMGLPEEAKKVYENTKLSGTVRQAIGYKEFFPYFKGEMSFEQAVDFLKQQTRRYAKRQLTWFRRNSDINWYYTDDYDNTETIYKEILLFVEKNSDMWYN